MKKLFTLFLLALLPLVASAFDVEIDGIYYDFDPSGAKKVTVTYEKYSNSTYISDYSRDVVIPVSVTFRNDTYSVTSIGKYAFSGCSSLTSVTIPNSVTSIGDYAFSDCLGLTSITIPNSVTYIGSSAFDDCIALTSLVIPNSVTSIGESVFSGCSRLTSVTIPNSVTSIGDYAFLFCSGLTSLEIPNSVTSIGEWAFQGCSGLTSLVIPNSVTSIGIYAFHGCSGLTSVTIPNSVTSIGYGAFIDCSGLTSIVVDAGNTAYDSREGCNAIIRSEDDVLIAGCMNTKIPNSVTSIGNYAFCECSGLTSLEIPNSVTSIGRSAFQSCSGLTSLEIPNSVTSIGAQAFISCSGLTSITIGDGVNEIGDYAFQQCLKLTDVFCKAKIVPNTPGSAFDESYLDNIILHVPAGSVAAYSEVEPWKNFKSIVAIETTDEFTLSFNGLPVADGATLLINAEGWSGLGSIYSSNDDNSKNGLFVFVNKGGKVSGSYSLEILTNTLNGDLKWCMGDETYALNDITTLEKTFSTDENGVASVKFSAENIPNEGSLYAKLIITIGEITKTFYIKVEFTQNESPDLTVSGKLGEPVDLGLSVKWASWNVGAGAPEEYGNHYAWGELEPKTDYSASTYSFYNNGYTKYGSIDSKYELDEADDVARQKWGEEWRMPTYDELKELYEKCTFSQETLNDVPVTKVTGPNGNYIYMPGPGNFTGQTLYFKDNVGSYWSRNLETDSYAKDLDFFTGSRSLNGDTRYHGQSVRPVYVGERESETIITIGSTGKGTYCSEYDLDFTDVEGIKAYTATGYDNKTKTIWVTRVYSVPAGTGIMVKGEPGEYKIPRVESQSYYVNMFKGNLGSKITIEETDGEWTNYYMKNGQFVSVNGTANIAANRCYLQLPTSVFAGTRSIEIVYDDEEEGTTGIMDHGQWIMDKTSDEWYTISGQRISQPTKKGLYIKDGKKVVIK